MYIKKRLQRNDVFEMKDMRQKGIYSGYVLFVWLEI